MTNVKAPHMRVSESANDSMIGLAADQPGIASPAFPGGEPIVFERAADSPFPDGYSLEKEAAVLKDLIDADDPDAGDPRWPRYELYLERLGAFERMQTEYQVTAGAESRVAPQEANKMRELGALVDDGVDIMELHTKEGFRMFMGRRRDPEGRLSAIPGGKRIASSLKALWLLSANDNPYADWALLRADERLTHLQKDLERQAEQYREEIERLQAKGLRFVVLRSREPKQVALGFKSPYGYAIAELIAEFDLFARVVKTLVRKNRFSDVQGRDVVRRHTRTIRAAFEEIARFERYLTKPDLLPLQRADFLPGADPVASKRTEAVTAILGVVPADIFAGRLTPRHSQRRMVLSEPEKALLERVAAELEAAEREAAATGDEASDAGLVE